MQSLATCLPTSNEPAAEKTTTENQKNVVFGLPAVTNTAGKLKERPGALLNQRKNSEAAVTVTPLPGSSSELFSQALKESSAIISSSYKVSK